VGFGVAGAVGELDPDPPHAASDKDTKAASQK
jgi:hypothetical protein